MSWFADLLAHLGIVRQLPTPEDTRAQKQRQTIRKADRVIEDYRRLDAALRVEVKKR